MMEQQSHVMDGKCIDLDLDVEIIDLTQGIPNVAGSDSATLSLCRNSPIYNIDLTDDNDVEFAGTCEDMSKHGAPADKNIKSEVVIEIDLEDLSSETDYKNDYARRTLFNNEQMNRQKVPKYPKIKDEILIGMELDGVRSEEHGEVRLINNLPAETILSNVSFNYNELGEEGEDSKLAQFEDRFSFSSHRHKPETGLPEFYQFQRKLNDCLKMLHNSTEPRPSSEEFADQPTSLLVPLLKHQQRGLKWMQYRERQSICGGILADDMGLGKTLSMISLVLATIQEKRKNEDIKRKALESQWNKEFNNLREQPKPAFSLFNYDDEDHKDMSAKEDDNKNKSDQPKEMKTPTNQIIDSDDDMDPYEGAGTLVVCPMSVMHQWANEATTKVADKYIKVLIYHGPNRRNIEIDTLQSYDIVITSYQTVVTERKRLYNSSRLFAVRWHRVILDEAHAIRNIKTACCNSVCALRSRCHWALTGTPIHNKATDVLALLCFLKVPNFKDLHHCRQYLSQGIQAHCRLNFIIKPLMLRRTKLQLQESGEMPSLPDLKIEIIEVILSDHEMAVYQILSAISQTIFAQFLRQREVGNVDLDYYHNNKTPNFMTKSVELKYRLLYDRFLISLGYDPREKVQGIVILVLLLRLRQFCCHPGLMVGMLCESMCPEEFDNMNNDIHEMVGHLKMDALVELDNYIANEYEVGDAKEEEFLFARENKKEKKISYKHEMKIEFKDEKSMDQIEDEIYFTQFKDEKHFKYQEDSKCSVPLIKEKLEPKFEEHTKKGLLAMPDEDAAIKLLCPSNPIFEFSRLSAKMKLVSAKLQQLLNETNDKIIVVSQWTQFLGIIERHLNSLSWETLGFNGSLNANKRQTVLDEFNDTYSSKRILLLSLTAGGVGLNLNVANHLLLIDLHWNPHLEQQAQDRIYRYGQHKTTYIYRFICKDTVEQRIQALQNYKLELAKMVLNAEQLPNGGPLSLEDLKKLFAMN